MKDYFELNETKQLLQTFRGKRNVVEPQQVAVPSELTSAFSKIIPFSEIANGFSRLSQKTHQDRQEYAQEKLERLLTHLAEEYFLQSITITDDRGLVFAQTQNNQFSPMKLSAFSVTFGGSLHLLEHFFGESVEKSLQVNCGEGQYAYLGSLDTLNRRLFLLCIAEESIDFQTIVMECDEMMSAIFQNE